jgi:hypothetical protein
MKIPAKRIPYEPGEWEPGMPIFAAPGNQFSRRPMFEVLDEHRCVGPIDKCAWNGDSARWPVPHKGDRIGTDGDYA